MPAHPTPSVPQGSSPLALQNAGIVAALALGRIAFGFQFQTLASLGPELVRVMGLDYAALGTLVGLYMAPGMLIALPGGLLGRRFGERLVVGVGFALMAGGALLAAAATAPPGIGLGRAVSGAGAVALTVMQGKMVSDRFQGPGFVTVMGILVGMFPVGVGLAGIALAPMLARFGWPGLFLMGGGIAVLAALVMAVSMRAGPVPLREAGGWSMPSRQECGLVAAAGLVWTFYNAGYYGFLSYLPSLLASRGHAAGEAALVLTIATWTNLPATILGGWLAGRWGGSRVFALGTASMLLAVAGPALLDWPLVWGLLFGSLGSIHAGVIVARGTLSARQENRSVGMGVFYTVYYVGGTGLPWLCGRAADAAGTPGGALLMGAALTSLSIPCFVLHRRWAASSPFVVSERTRDGGP